MATHSSILAWDNPMVRGAWRATVHGVTQSRTQLKPLSTQTCHPPAPLGGGAIMLRMLQRRDVRPREVVTCVRTHREVMLAPRLDQAVLLLPSAMGFSQEA